MVEIVVIAAVGLALVVLVVAASLAASVTRIVKRSLYCPFVDRDVTAEFVEATWDGRPVAVPRCSAFGAGAVTCGVPCLRVVRTREFQGTAASSSS
jgi:hypothetical protein